MLPSSLADGSNRTPRDLSRAVWLALFLGLIGLTVLAYSPTFGLHYHADDYPLLARPRRLIDSLGWVGYLGSLFGPPPDNWGATFYRPLWEASFGLDAALGYRPEVSRWINLGLHGGTALATAGLARGLGLSRAASLVVATAFALSPVCHEVIGWVCARSTSFVDVFLVGALATQVQSKTGRDLWARLSLALLAGAFLTKDSAILYPALLLPTLLACAALRGESKVPFLLRHSRLPLIGYAILFAARWVILGQPIGGYADDRRYLDGPQEVLQAFKSLTPGWSWPFAEAIPFGLPGLGAGALFFASVVLATAYLTRTTDKAQSTAAGVQMALGLTLSLAALIPVFGYQQLGIEAPNTRYFHLPSVGWALVLGAAAEGFAARTGRPLRFLLGFGLVLAAGQGLALRLHLSAYQPGDQLLGTILDQAESLATQTDGPVVLMGAPDTLGAVLVGGETLPHAMKPPFCSISNPDRVQAVCGGPPSWKTPDWIAALSLVSSGVDPLVWNPALRRFEPNAWPWAEGQIAGLVERSEDGVTVAGHPIRFGPAFEESLVPGLVGQFIRIDVAVPRPMLSAPSSGVRTKVQALGPWSLGKPSLNPVPGRALAFEIPDADPGQAIVLLMSRKRRATPFGRCGVLHLERPFVKPIPADPENGPVHLEVPELAGSGIWIQAVYRADNRARLTEPHFVPGM